MKGTAVTTECFRITPSVYLRYMARSVTLRLLLFLIIPLSACLIASVWDLRWAFVALILLFLVAPMVISYIYFTRLLTPEAQRALSPKRISFSIPGDGTDSRWEVTVTYVCADEENVPPPPTSFPGESVGRVLPTKRHIVLETDRLGYPLIIPVEALGENSEKIKEFLFKKSGDYYCS